MNWNFQLLIFRFVEPHGVAPKKSALDSPKPSSYENFNSKSPKLWKNERKFSCLSFDSTGSCDDGFLEVWDLDKSVSKIMFIHLFMRVPITFKSPWLWWLNCSRWLCWLHLSLNTFLWVLYYSPPMPWSGHYHPV